MFGVDGDLEILSNRIQQLFVYLRGRKAWNSRLVAEDQLTLRDAPLPTPHAEDDVEQGSMRPAMMAKKPWKEEVDVAVLHIENAS